MHDAAYKPAFKEDFHNQQYNATPVPNTLIYPQPMKRESNDVTKPAQPQRDHLVDYIEKLPAELRNVIFELTFHIPHEIILVKRPRYLKESQIQAFANGIPESRMAQEARPYAQWVLEARHQRTAVINLNLFQEFYAAEYADDKEIGLMRDIGDPNFVRKNIVRALSYLKDSDIECTQYIISARRRSRNMAGAGSKFVFPSPTLSTLTPTYVYRMDVCLPKASAGGCALISRCLMSSLPDL